MVWKCEFPLVPNQPGIYLHHVEHGHLMSLTSICHVICHHSFALTLQANQTIELLKFQMGSLVHGQYTFTYKANLNIRRGHRLGIKFCEFQGYRKCQLQMLLPMSKWGRTGHITANWFKLLSAPVGWLGQGAPVKEIKVYQVKLTVNRHPASRKTQTSKPSSTAFPLSLPCNR